MANARKMILVDPSALERLKTAPTPSLSRKQSLDSEMESLLRRQDLNDYDKWAAYSQLLQRYLHKTQEEREPLSLRITEAQQQQGRPDVGAPDTVTVVTTPAVGDLAQRGNPLLEQVIEAVPVSHQRKARLLYRLLKHHPSEISWNSRGEVTIEGVFHSGSNITDLISDVLRARKSFKPAHHEEFAVALARVNVPQELVSNPERWRLVQLACRATRLLRQSLAKPAPSDFQQLHNDDEDDYVDGAVGGSPFHATATPGTFWEKFKI